MTGLTPRALHPATAGRFPRLLLSLALALAILTSGCDSAATLPIPFAPAPANRAEPGTNVVPATGAISDDSVPLATPTGESGPAAATATAVPSPEATPTLSPSPTRTVEDPRFSAANAYRQLRALSETIGARPSGSIGSLRAASYVKSHMDALGYETRTQDYAFNHFEERSATVTLRGPDPVEIPARALIYSGGGYVEGNVVYCGVGRPFDFPQTRIDRKIALIDRGGGLTFQEKADNAFVRGGAAVMIANDRGGELQGVLLRPASSPVIGILQVDGQSLKEQLRKLPVTLNIEDGATNTTLFGSNIIATLPAEGDSTGTVIVGAHYDSVAGCPGANDNGSGVSTLLELARASRDQQYPFDLIFVAFGDEEVGLVGSSRFVQSLTGLEKRRILAMINLDMVGVGNSLQIGGDRTLVALANQAARQAGYAPQGLRLPEGTTSDQESFQAAGIPSILIYRGDDPNYHTAQDTVEQVASPKLESAGRVVSGLLDQLSSRQ